MTGTPEDAMELLRKMRMDLTNAQAKLTDAITAIAAIPATPKPDRTCPECGLVTKGPLALAEHKYNRHDGPTPEHYLAAERAAGIES